MTFPTGRRLFLHSLKLPPCQGLMGNLLWEKGWGGTLSVLGLPTWNSFRDPIKEQYYLVGSYEDKYIQWTTLWHKRDQDVHELTNLFHTLHTKLGIKYLEKHLVLRYHSWPHRYIQEEIGFLDISSLGTTYRYVAKIEQKFKQKKRDFGSANQKQGKGASKPQKKGQSQGMVAKDNPSKPQE